MRPTRTEAYFMSEILTNLAQQSVIVSDDITTCSKTTIILFILFYTITVEFKTEHMTRRCNSCMKIQSWLIPATQRKQQ